MHGLTLAKILIYLGSYGYSLLFPIAILEGPIVSVLAGFLVSLHQFNFWLAFGVLVLGDLTGDMLLYAVGRWGSRSLLHKWGERLGITEAKLNQAERFYHNHSKKTLLFGKWSHALGMVVLVAAGTVKGKFWEFAWVNLLGTLPKTLFFVLIGYYFGSWYQRINSYIEYAAVGIGTLIITFGIVYYISIRVGKKVFQEK